VKDEEISPKNVASSTPKELSPIQVKDSVSPSISQSLSSPQVQTPVVQKMVVNRMDAIVAARYAPLVMPRPLNAFPVERLS
jgi:hypothetical protein